MKKTMMKRTGLNLSIMAAAAAAVMLAACGGGSGGTSDSTQTGSQGTFTSSGTVTGFGSVIVDGVRIDDSKVLAGIEQDDDTITPTELKIGHHVEVSHDDSLLPIASLVRILPELKGPVGTIDAAAKTLTVLGQTVVINTVAGNGPVTVFETPYTQLSDIKSGDMIEVHGLIKVDAAGKVTLQATRIEQPKVVSKFNRVKGHVTALTPTTFMLGSLLIRYTDAKMKPTGAVLANGSEVHVFILTNTTATDGATNAEVVKVKNRHDDSGDHEAKIGGAITALNATKTQFTVDGVTVDASQAKFEQKGKTIADLLDGVYLRVKGTYLANGTFKATSIILRGQKEDEGREIELHGSILNFTSNANFTLRGLGIDASSLKIPLSCTLANNVQVQVEGQLSASGKVVATEVKCETEKERESMIFERKGLVGNFNLANKTLTLSGAPSPVVQWNAATLFVGIDPTSLNGLKDGVTVEIEGTITGTVFLATKIKLENNK